MRNIIITLCEQCGNAFAKVCEKTCACPSFIEQNTTNKFDETIVFTLCYTLCIIALIAALTIIITFIIKHIANHCKEKKERKYKQEQRDFELKKEYQAKALDYLKGEMDTYKKLAVLISEFQKVSDKIDKLKEEDHNNEETNGTEESTLANENLEKTKGNNQTEGKPEKTKGNKPIGETPEETNNDKFASEEHTKAKNKEVTISEVKRTMDEILDIFKDDKDDKNVLKVLFDKMNEGKCGSDTKGIYNDAGNAYLNKLKQYIENIPGPQQAKPTKTDTNK